MLTAVGLVVFEVVASVVSLVTRAETTSSVLSVGVSRDSRAENVGGGRGGKRICDVLFTSCIIRSAYRSALAWLRSSTVMCFMRVV